MLETNRCKLLALEEYDYSEVRQLYLNEEVRRFLGGPIDENSYRSRFIDMLHSNGNSYYWVIRRKQDNAFIGLVSLDNHHNDVDMEVSYQILPEWWGLGYATEVVTSIIAYSFQELGLPRVIAETQVANEASCQLLRRVGMKLEEIIERFGSEQAIFSIYKT